MTQNELLKKKLLGARVVEKNVRGTKLNFYKDVNELKKISPQNLMS